MSSPDSLLKSDITRCHERGCTHETTCLRYLQRDINVTTGTSHIATCVPEGESIPRSYPMLLTVNDF